MNDKLTDYFSPHEFRDPKGQRSGNGSLLKKVLILALFAAWVHITVEPWIGPSPVKAMENDKYLCSHLGQYDTTGIPSDELTSYCKTYGN